MAFASAGQSRLNLSSPFNDLARGLNDKQQIDTVLLDFSKAFDRVRKRGISVLIDLKAELFRKQEEFKQQKLLSQNTSFIKGKGSGAEKKKPNIWSKKNAGVTQRAAKDYEEKLEEEDVFERSKKSLETKARLYEKISSGKELPDEDGSGLYLVDFQKKVLDDVFEQRDRARKEEEERQRKEIEEEKQQLQESVPEPENEEDEWVDFVDSLGRSRRCLKKDLPDLQQQDRELMERKKASVSSVSKDFQSLRDKTEGGGTNSLMSDDMRRELQRQEWERQELETMEEEKSGPIHYSDVRHNEIRSHGVGFFEFDKDEAARQEQLKDLNQLREETKTERSKKDRIKEKRKAALEARLAKVKQRRKLKTSDLEETESMTDEVIGPKIEEKSETTDKPTTVENTDNKPEENVRTKVPKIREWDRGKEKLLERSETNWLERQRAERYDEFAPPREYYNAPKPVQKGWSQEKKSSIFAKINKIKLSTKSDDSDKPLAETVSEKNSAGDGDYHVSVEHDRTHIASEWNNSVISDTSDCSDRLVQRSDRLVQQVPEEPAPQLPFGFDPSVPPPVPLIQPSWFPQQQTGVHYSTVTNQEYGISSNQSANMPSFTQNPSAANQYETSSHTITDTQTVTTYQNLPDSGNYMYTTPQEFATYTPTTEQQSSFTPSNTFEQYPSALPTNSSYTCDTDVKSANPNVVGYSVGSQETVSSTEKKVVIPKMKILDTRLMQNEGD